MDRLNPDVINSVRAQNQVGPDSITHVHHVPRPREDVAEATIEDTIEPVLQEKKSPRHVQLFRSALRGVRGELHDTTDT